MTTPDLFDEELGGSTRPDVLALALSGHLAAAAGGENHLSQEVGEQVVAAQLLPAIEQARAELAAQQESEAQGVQDPTPPQETPGTVSAKESSKT